jgi:hypothetical protein
MHLTFVTFKKQGFESQEMLYLLLHDPSFIYWNFWKGCDQENIATNLTEPLK